MAELKIGDHCSLKECHLLDFLPLECDKCHLSFCKIHIYYINHNCQSFSSEISDCGAVRNNSSSISYDCSFRDCTQKELIEIICECCGQIFCLQHRHPQDHKCPEKPTNRDKKAKTAKLVDSLSFDKVKNTKFTKPLNSRSANTTAKIALMKIKLKAKGDTGLPVDDRIYFDVMFEDSHHYVFFDKCWSIGKCLDQLAKTLKIDYQRRNLSKLHLFADLESNNNMELPLDEKLVNLMSQGTLFSGETLTLKYV
ncbi:hypothetical protein HELRODRAFT_159053 [Helobdella robusta]|uniref:AN1-type domain-containing protein n=1 Tax=Helobdella robusta TaxID=6412 RepID=T1ENJ3_HELRO|nr:hypothetical protein HELRODRAFT_159053 [Helobdella robusta]ESO12505.1 hypothetical protein HELRODRAFT_159053 [Helobdella robusta]